MKAVKGLSLLMVICFIFLAACSSPQESNGETQANSSEPIVLKTTIQTPPVAVMSKGFDAYLDAIEQKTNGRIKFERYYSESLVKSADVIDALSSGIADVGVIIPAYMGSKMPLNTVVYNPVVFENSWAGARAVNELYQNTPELNEELAEHGVKFAGQLAVPSNYIWTTKPVQSNADLKGMKLIAPGDHGVIAQSLGAAPVALTSTESFEALQRGTVDGTIFNLSAATTYNIEQAANNLYKLPIGGVVLLIGMSLDKYNSLPDDIRQMIQEVSVSHADDFHKIYQTDGDKDSLDKLAKANGKVVEPSQSDVNQLKEIAKNIIWKNWIDKNGEASQAILDRYVELAEKYENENPYKTQ